jgi:hypothetical protein
MSIIGKLWKYVGIFYDHFWFYTQGVLSFFVRDWRNKYLRRPYTFVMYEHSWTFWLLTAIVFFPSWWFSPTWLQFIICIIWGCLVGHVFWSTNKSGQQENPTFIK